MRIGIAIGIGVAGGRLERSGSDGVVGVSLDVSRARGYGVSGGHMRKIVSMAEIQDRFRDCLRAAEEGDMVVVTRDGKPVVALIAMSEVDRLERSQPGPEAGLAGLAGGWEGSEELIQHIAESPRTPSRAMVDLD